MSHEENTCKLESAETEPDMNAEDSAGSEEQEIAALPLEAPKPNPDLSHNETSNGIGKQTSPKKLAANRANAQHSTGPKTEEGKTKSKFNAVKHGLTARHFPSIIQKDSAEWQQFNELHASMADHFQPVGPIEELLVEKIAIEFLRFGRHLVREQDPKVLASGFYAQVVDKMVRYQSAINRQLFQAIAELDRQQEKRKSQADEIE